MILLSVRPTAYTLLFAQLKNKLVRSSMPTTRKNFSVSESFLTVQNQMNLHKNQQQSTITIIINKHPSSEFASGSFVHNFLT
jgi:hypothetical protein